MFCHLTTNQPVKMPSLETNLTHHDNLICKPVLFDLSNPSDHDELNKLLTAKPYIRIIDEIQGQLLELLKLRSPKIKFTEESLNQEVTNYLSDKDVKEYGNWAYYPWLEKIVHILNEDDFIEVRTNRNHYKITPQEEAILNQKTIGIIGLSVGKAIALTIATERICGSLVLADFDVIELSNLNRIQTGVQNLNTKKTVVVAREIAEIDPYLDVRCFHEGIDETNLDDFFAVNGRLDVCIEVCDGLLTKIQTRQVAKKLGIPVVMNSSDRGTTDVERFDLDPDWPIFHGLIDHLDLSKVKEAKTNEQKVPYLLPMIGIDTASERLRASILEIEGSITTWPQLASGVIFGGGICTDVCRRILLNQYTKSGRYIVDVETIINDDVENDILEKQLDDYAVENPKINLSDYQDELQQAQDKLFHNDANQSVNLEESVIADIVKYAVQAPSGGNVQPWNWVYKNGSLLLFNDVERSNSILNFNNTGSLLSFGAALENIELAAENRHLKATTEYFPLGENNQLIARIAFSPLTTPSHPYPTLVDHVFNRCTNRNLGPRKEIESDKLNMLTKTVQSIHGADMRLFTDPGEMEQFKSIIGEIDKLFMTNKIGHGHFTKEIRWNETEVQSTRDGIDIDTIDLTATERAGLILSKNWNVTKHIKKWGLGNEFGKLSQKAINAASCLGMVTMPSRSNTDYLNAGMAVQRLWLAASQLDIALQPMSISSFLFARIDDDDFSEIEELRDGIIQQYDLFRNLTKLETEEKDIFFFRLSTAQSPEIMALRRKVEDVFSYIA